MSSRNLHKAENPSAYAKLAREGMMIGYPVKIRGESHRSDNNIPYHSTLKFFNTEKDHPHQIHHLARHLSLNAPDPKTTQIEPSQLKDRLGNDVYVLKLKGNSAEKMKEHNAKFSHMGDPQSYVYEPHISVPKSVHDKIKSSGAKTAHEAGIEFGPAELKHGSKTLKVYRHEPDSAEPKFPDYGDFTSKINKSEEILDESTALPEDEDAHALLNRQEDKYFLPKKYIEQVIIALSDRLALGDIDTDTRYNTNRTIYLDDKDLNTFHECMLKKKPRMKVRIRQYSPNSQGWEEVAYAEFKMKEEDGFTKKIRVRLPSKYVEILSNGGQITLDENLVNINKDIDRKALEARVKAINSIIFRRGLRRQLEVRYERRAYTGKNLRITIDENLRYMDATPISENVKKVLEEEKEWKEFSEPYILAAWENPFILEIKSDKEVPGWLKQLLKEVNAKRASFSKYSAAILNQIKTDKNEGDVLGTVGYLDSTSDFEKSENTMGQKPLMKPYVSEAQRRWAHTPNGKKALGGNAGVHEWDEATKGKKLPEKVGKSEELEKSDKVDIAIVVLRDGNFILIGKRRRNKKWGLPGGRNEGKGESNEACALRELEEETGIKLKPEDLSLEGIRKIKAGGENKHVYVYTAQFPGGEPTTKNDPDEEFTKWRWMRCENGQLPDEILDGEMTPPAEAAFDKLNMTKNEEILEKGALKNSGVALGMAGALAGASAPKANPQNLQPTPQTIQGPKVPVFNPQKMLQAIAQTESSGGKHEHHEPLPNGEVAFGKYGLLPSTIKDTIKGHKDLSAKYGKALALQGPQFHNYMKDNAGLEDVIAQRHLSHMQHVLGSDPNAISYGWLNGINGTLKAQKEGKDIPNHWYTKRVMNTYNKGK